MPRKATGSQVEWSEAMQAWTTRVRLADGSRPRLRIDGARSEGEARKLAPRLVARVKRDGLVRSGPGAGGGTTFAVYAERWLEAREAKGYTSVRVDRSALKIHATPLLGEFAMAAITPSHIRSVVEALDEKIDAEELSAKSASNVWACLHKLFVDARRSKREALRVIESDPFADVEGPESGAERTKCFLYPSEFVTFLECDDVPEDVRAWCAMQTWHTLRPAELYGLDPADIDTEHWSAHVHRTRDLKLAADGTTKTERDRHVPIEPSIRPLVAALLARARTNGGRLFPELPFRAAAASEELRRWLRVAGINREALHVSDKTRRAFRLYDCRGTGATWLAVRKDSSASIQERIGHADYRQTQAYIRQVNVFSNAFGTPFPLVPESLVRAIHPTGPDRDRTGGPGCSPIAAISNEIESGRDRDRTAGPALPPNAADVVSHASDAATLQSRAIANTGESPRSDLGPNVDRLAAARADLATRAHAAMLAHDFDTARRLMDAAEKLASASVTPAPVVPIGRGRVTR